MYKPSPVKPEFGLHRLTETQPVYLRQLYPVSVTMCWCQLFIECCQVNKAEAKSTSQLKSL